MKLTELDPRWVGLGNGSDFRNGLTFLCPHCVALGKRDQRLGVFFRPPIDPQKWESRITNGGYSSEIKCWDREGDTFETLSLSPSIDCSGTGRIDFPGHWHGHIQLGEIK